MDLENCIKQNSIVLSEGAILERLRRLSKLMLHPRMAHSLFIYEKDGREELEGLYNSYINVACESGFPIILYTPTWRANKERILEAGIQSDVNADAVEFMNNLKIAHESFRDKILIGALMGCKNDCYKPGEGLNAVEAQDFHSWQIERLLLGGAEFITAQTLPSLHEALGISAALSGAYIPYCISFVINSDGYILDGNSLEKAVALIDDTVLHPPLGYMINCSYPAFLKIESLAHGTLSRIIGYLANASSLSHDELDCSKAVHKNNVRDWGDRMIGLNKNYGVKILGGCCGTDEGHLRYIAKNI